MREVVALLLLGLGSSAASAVGICFVPSESGHNVTIDCTTPIPSAWANAFVGYSIDIAPCRSGSCSEFGGNPYEWSISSSSVNPRVNTGPLDAGTVELYLWLSCSNVDGVGVAVFGLQTDDPSIVLTELTPVKGVLNAGTAHGPLLSVPNCPPYPFLAASLTLVLSPTATEPETWGRVKSLYR